MLSPEDRDTLLDTARAAIDYGLHHGGPPRLDTTALPDALKALRASFVTLHLDGRLRGCIGTLEARLPLAEDVNKHAYEAAFRDPRFAPLSAAELADIELHVAVLSPRTVLHFATEADLIDQLRPGIDGLVIQRDQHSATFLPSVWESLPDAALFLSQLKQKAGFSPCPQQAWRYTTESFP